MNRLKPFSYFDPATVSEAVEILAKEGSGAYPLAGGTDLLVRRKRGDVSAATFVNLKRLTELAGIQTLQGWVRIGALTTIAELEQSSTIQGYFPVLAEAAGKLGSPSIRNLGTMGGNIGRASPASDLAPSLIVLKARLIVQGPMGKKECDIERFFRGPGATVLSPGEIITSFLVPEMATRSAGAYEKLGRRDEMDCALVGAAAVVTLASSNVELKDARVSLASVGPTPLRARRAEEVLLSGCLNPQRLKQAAAAAADECMPISDMRASATYRRDMVRVLLGRALERAIASARKDSA